MSGISPKNQYPPHRATVASYKVHLELFTYKMIEIPKREPTNLVSEHPVPATHEPQKNAVIEQNLLESWFVESGTEINQSAS